MIAISKTPDKSETVTWQDEFLKMMPKIEQHARVAFRHPDADKKEDAVSEVVANAMCAYRRLHERGELQRVFAGALARSAIKQYRDGRRVGTPQCSRDVFSRRAQCKAGFGVRSFGDVNPRDGDWMECLFDERHTPVPDQVDFLIDFPTWLSDQSIRNQHIIEKLSQRYSTSEVAGEFEVSLGRVSQLRREFADSWREFNSTSENGLGSNDKYDNQT